MDKRDWLAFLGVSASIALAIIAAWVTLEGRMATIEAELKQLNQTDRTLVKEIIKTIKHIEFLRGQHEGHDGVVTHDHPAEEVQAQSWLTESEM